MSTVTVGRSPGWRVSPNAKIGLHAVVPGRLGGDRIEMAVGRAGYVGAAALPNGRIDVAAAINPRALRAAESPATLMNDLRTGAGFGVRLEVPMVGRIGLDYGYGFDKSEPGWEAHFNFGTIF